MTPATFANVVVLPTVREHLAARGDRRLAYLACIATYSLVEYVARAEAGAGASKAKLDEKREDVGEAIRAVCAPAYEVVQGICNGTKHAGSDRGQFPFTPGTERVVPILAFDTGISGFDEGRFDVPGLDVEHNGARLFIDWCVQEVLRAFVEQCPKHISGLDLSFLDPQFQPKA